MQITIPDFSLVILIGATGSGKSTFASRCFLSTEVISSDACRAMVGDNDEDQSVTPEAFEILYAIAERRLKLRRLAVIDATNLRPNDRAKAIDLARRYHALPVAIVFDIAPEISIARNAVRANRRFGPRVVHDHVALLRKSMKKLRNEGFRVVHILEGENAASNAEIIREPLYNDKRNLHGPFDLIGDVHGCFGELCALFERLGYQRSAEGSALSYTHPDGRIALFLGDLVDRGPGVVETLELVMNMTASGSALCVIGNHEFKLLRKLQGNAVKETHGLTETLAQINALPEDERLVFTTRLMPFLEGLISHLWLDDGNLLAAHAGLRAEMHGRGSGAVRQFAMYGETTGETDEFGLPVRYNWAADYRGKAAVVYGHTPVPEATWLNNTICIDTGCVYGGKLTALRYPERELVSVDADQVYSDPIRPLGGAEASTAAQQISDRVLLLDDVAGKQTIRTSIDRTVRIDDEHAAAALEIMSRFCADPRWLMYLPPTMSPPETSPREDVLEHPDEAFTYYERNGLSEVILEEKHMGSRAVIILARDEAAARERFDVESGRGVILTRTGRHFFSANHHIRTDEILDRISEACEKSGLWDRLSTNWLCLDAEIMPWSVKAQELIDQQYAPVGEAATAGLQAAHALLAAAIARGATHDEELPHFDERLPHVEGYISAFRRYVSPVTQVNDLRIAPFHLLASEGAVHTDKPHAWHMETLHSLCASDPSLLQATQYRSVKLDDANARADAITWWETLTQNGGEGIVVKPASFIARGRNGIVQPALKVRGSEYLRIVYGPEYQMPKHLERLRERAVAKKRRLALDELALGLEGLQRFVARKPLREVHRCVFGILALESEPIDPRL